MTALLVQNKKMINSSNDGIKVFNFGIPAFRSKGGIATCPMAGACAAGCYAKSGAYVWKTVAAAYEYRLAATQKDDFNQAISKELTNKVKRAKKIYVRIHDSGDFYNAEYLSKWLNIIQSFPQVEFYAYTKMITLFKGRMLPKNFKVIFSLGGREDLKIDQSSERHSKVFESETELVEQGYVNASKDDLIALGENKKIGLVYHGAKSFKNTAWDRVA